MKNTTKPVMESPCPFRTKKRPMSRSGKALQRSPKTFKSLLFFLLIWSCAQSFAFGTATQKETKLSQQHLLTGTITDTQGQPLIGATVQDQKSGNNTQTNKLGQFQLQTNATTGVLTISYLGYQPKTVSYQTGNPLHIQLTEDPSTLKAVEINTGYYSVKKALMTGAISSISAKDIEKQPVANPLSTLQGRITGAYIQQTSATPGGNINLTIRGRNGIDASSNPLYLVDGIPFGGPSLTNTFSVSSNVHTNGGASPLNTIAPEDIESIEILKDADATAIYGSRGANGVVLITTKKGRSGKTSIEASAQSGSSKVATSLPMLQTPDYLELRKLAFSLDNIAHRPTDYDLNGKWDQSRNTNWQKELIGNSASFANYRTAITGGSQTHSYLLSASHNRQGTMYQKDLGYQRTALHLSTSHQSTDQKFKATTSVSYSLDDTNWTNTDLTPRALNLSPNAPALRTETGAINWEGSTFVNPLRSLEWQYLGQNSNLTAATKLSYRPIKNLELSTNLGYNALTLDDRNSTPVSYYDPAEGRTSANSSSDFGNAYQKGWSAEAQASYQLQLGKGRLSLLLGTTLQQTQRKALYQRGTGYASDALLASIISASAIQVRAATQSNYRYGGSYARINYNLQEKYLLNLTARRDGTSRFGSGKRMGNFGAIGIGWLFASEDFIKNLLPQLSTGKLRASYGISGNDQIGDYEYLDTYQASSGYNLSAGLAPLRLFNPDFSWEQNRKLELGLDLGFFRDRLTLTLGHYRNMATSLLVEYPLSMVTGFRSIRNNLDAKVANNGWEVEISSRQLQGKDFRWSSSFNLTIPTNKLVSFPGLAASTYSSSLSIGHSLGAVKAYQLEGVDPQTGTYRYTDFNGDGTINASDRQVILDRRQRYYGGLDNSFGYGNLELSFLFQYVSQIAGTFRAQYSIMPGALGNQPQAYQGKYWTKPGDIAEFQRPSTGAHAGAAAAWGNYSVSDAVISDANFIRLKNVSLSYRNSKWLKGATIRLFAQGQNLWTISDYFGLDPESANANLPLLRTYTFGLQLTL